MEGDSDPYRGLRLLKEQYERVPARHLMSLVDFVEARMTDGGMIGYHENRRDAIEAALREAGLLK